MSVSLTLHFPSLHPVGLGFVPPTSAGLGGIPLTDVMAGSGQSRFKFLVRISPILNSMFGSVPF